MSTLKLVAFQWISEEREKHISEDLYSSSWDEIIGRMYLLKAHDIMASISYRAALADFQKALALLAKDGVNRDYYACALNDKALVQCFVGKYKTALETIDQALAVVSQSNRMGMVQTKEIVLANRAAILVLNGAYSEALELLSTQLQKDPKDVWLLFTQATCLLHLERYTEAIAAYEKVIAEKFYLGDEGLEAARLGKQPDWDEL